MPAAPARSECSVSPPTPATPLEFLNMEFVQELCQAELAALRGPRRGIRSVGGAAPPPRPPRPRGAADPAGSSPAEPPRRVQNRRRRGTSRAQRPHATLPGPRRVAAGRPRRGPEPKLPAGPVCWPPPALGARGSASSPLPGPGPRSGVRRGGRGVQAAAGKVGRSRRVFVLF